MQFDPSSYQAFDTLSLASCSLSFNQFVNALTLTRDEKAALAVLVEGITGHPFKTVWFLSRFNSQQLSSYICEYLKDPSTKSLHPAYVNDFATFLREHKVFVLPPSPAVLLHSGSHCLDRDHSLVQPSHTPPLATPRERRAVFARHPSPRRPRLHRHPQRVVPPLAAARGLRLHHRARGPVGPGSRPGHHGQHGARERHRHAGAAVAPRRLSHVVSAVSSRSTPSPLPQRWSFAPMTRASSSTPCVPSTRSWTSAPPSPRWTPPPSRSAPAAHCSGSTRCGATRDSPATSASSRTAAGTTDVGERAIPDPQTDSWSSSAARCRRRRPSSPPPRARRSSSPRWRRVTGRSPTPAFPCRRASRRGARRSCWTASWHCWRVPSSTRRRRWWRR